MNMFDFVGLLGRRSQSIPTVHRDMLTSLLSLAWVVEARDPYTGGHLWRVSRYANLVAERAGMTERQVAQISVGGFLHDLGKIGIPDAILRKTEKLDDDEYAIVKTHPEVGRILLSRHPLAQAVVDAVYSHHERPDGKGYPGGLRQGEISEMAAIVGVCDAFDAMTSARPYRSPLPTDKALRIIEDNLGTQFDKRYGEVLLDLSHTTEIRHIQGHSDDGIPLRDCLSCGPTIVVTKAARQGSTVFCPACGHGYELQSASLKHVPRETRATSADLIPTPDEDLINRIATAHPAFFQTASR